MPVESSLLCGLRQVSSSASLSVSASCGCLLLTEAAWEGYRQRLQHIQIDAINAHMKRPASPKNIMFWVVSVSCRYPRIQFTLKRSHPSCSSSFCAVPVVLASAVDVCCKWRGCVAVGSTVHCRWHARSPPCTACNVLAAVSLCTPEETLKLYSAC